MNCFLDLGFWGKKSMDPRFLGVGFKILGSTAQRSSAKSVSHGFQGWGCRVSGLGVTATGRHPYLEL